MEAGALRVGWRIGDLRGGQLGPGGILGSTGPTLGVDWQFGDLHKRSGQRGRDAPIDAPTYATAGADVGDHGDP